MLDPICVEDPMPADEALKILRERYAKAPPEVKRVLLEKHRPMMSRSEAPGWLYYPCGDRVVRQADFFPPGFTGSTINGN